MAAKCFFANFRVIFVSRGMVQKLAIRKRLFDLRGREGIYCKKKIFVRVRERERERVLGRSLPFDIIMSVLLKLFLHKQCYITYEIDKLLLHFFPFLSLSIVIQYSYL